MAHCRCFPDACMICYEMLKHFKNQGRCARRANLNRQERYEREVFRRFLSALPGTARQGRCRVLRGEKMTLTEFSDSLLGKDVFTTENTALFEYCRCFARRSRSSPSE